MCINAKATPISNIGLQLPYNNCRTCLTMQSYGVHIMTHITPLVIISLRSKHTDANTETYRCLHRTNFILSTHQPVVGTPSLIIFYVKSFVNFDNSAMWNVGMEYLVWNYYLWGCTTTDRNGICELAILSVTHTFDYIVLRVNLTLPVMKTFRHPLTIKYCNSE